MNNALIVEDKRKKVSFPRRKFGNAREGSYIYGINEDKLNKGYDRINSRRYKERFTTGD